MEDRGLDVYTGGVSAYSTLGWFDDSLTNTIINRSNTQLARLIFHELAHQVVYIPGDTTFNESFATVVEMEGLRRWLKSSGQSDVVASELERQTQRQQFVDLVTEHRDRLNILYQSNSPDSSKRLQKGELQLSLRQEFLLLAEEWGSSGGYDSWFSGSLNNAQLSTVTSYNDLVPYFENLLAQSNGDLETFYNAFTGKPLWEIKQRIVWIRPKILCVYFIFRLLHIQKISKGNVVAHTDKVSDYKIQQDDVHWKQLEHLFEDKKGRPMDNGAKEFAKIGVELMPENADIIDDILVRGGLKGPINKW